MHVYLHGTCDRGKKLKMENELQNIMEQNITPAV